MTRVAGAHHGIARWRRRGAMALGLRTCTDLAGPLPSCPAGRSSLAVAGSAMFAREQRWTPRPGQDADVAGVTAQVRPASSSGGVQTSDSARPPRSRSTAVHRPAISGAVAASFESEATAATQASEWPALRRGTPRATATTTSSAPVSGFAKRAKPMGATTVSNIDQDFLLAGSPRFVTLASVPLLLASAEQPRVLSGSLSARAGTASRRACTMALPGFAHSGTGAIAVHEFSAPQLAEAPGGLDGPTSTTMVGRRAPAAPARIHQTRIHRSDRKEQCRCLPLPSPRSSGS